MWFARPRFWATRGSATHLHACCQCGARICRRDTLDAAAARCHSWRATLFAHRTTSQYTTGRRRGHHLPIFPGRQRPMLSGRGRRAGASHRRRSSMSCRRRGVGVAQVCPGAHDDSMAYFTDLVQYGAGGHLATLISPKRPTTSQASGGTCRVWKDRQT